MNYSIIKNEEELQRFIDIVLVDTTKEEQFYVSLLARNKWNPQPNWKGDQAQLKRFTSTKERLIEKIKQLEVELGRYKNNGIEIPNDNLGLYIMPNPRSLKKAQLSLLKTIANNVINNEFHDNPQAMALSEIQKNCGNKIYYDLDVDIKTTDDNKRTQILFDINKVVYNYFDAKDVIAIKTSGGYHILLKVVNAKNNKWFKAIDDLDANLGGVEIEMNGDNLLPIPGCVQGKFVPQLMNF